MVMVGLGGILGAAARYLFGKWMADRTESLFPISTWIINVSGSLLLGILYGLHARAVLAQSLWLLLGVGFCGAYTTFSTFGYETMQLLEQARYSRALYYVIASVVIGLIAAWLGVAMTGA